MIKAMNIAVFPAEMPLDEVFSAAKKAGFSAVELNYTAERKTTPGLFLGVADDEVRKVGELLKKHELGCVGVVTDQLWTYHLTSDDSANRARAEEIIREMIHGAALLGAKNVLIVPGVVNDKVSYLHAYENALASLRMLGKEAEHAGITLSVENVWNKFLLSPIEMRDFIDRVGSPAVGAYFDAGNCANNCASADWVEILGKRINRVHIKGFDNTTNQFVGIHQGTISWQNVVEALDRVGYNGYLTTEMWTQGDVMEAVRGFSKDLDEIIKYHHEA